MSLSKIRKDLSRRELYFFAGPVFFHSMPTSLVVLLVILRSLIRSRFDLQLENLALRHQIGVLQRSLKKRPKITATDPPLGFSVAYMARLALGISHRQAGNGCGLASQGLPLALDLEGSTGTTGTARDCPRDSRPDPQDVAGESYLGRTPHSRRFRISELKKSECPEFLQHFWSGHAQTHVSERYTKLLKDRDFRLEWTEKIGMGFEVPAQSLGLERHRKRGNGLLAASKWKLAHDELQKGSHQSFVIPILPSHTLRLEHSSGVFILGRRIHFSGFRVCQDFAL